MYAKTLTMILLHGEKAFMPQNNEIVKSNTNKHTKLRILLIQLEFLKWERARSWSYSTQLGFEEGFRSNMIEFITVPAIYEFSAKDSRSWLSHIQNICDNKDFDQVWIELVHNNIDDDFLQWLTTVAPVRVAILGESLQYPPEIYVTTPSLQERHSLIKQRLKYMTHALTGDEEDAKDLNTRKVVKAMWWNYAVPERFICEHPSSPQHNVATFCGALYGDRSKWLELFPLTNLLVRPEPPENATPYPKLFDSLNTKLTHYLKNCVTVSEKDLSSYLESLRQIRKECFTLWLEGLRSGCAVVNLPHFVQAYPGRIVEGMAAGRPVISCEIPDRPRTKALFEDGKEILLFKKDDPEMLANHIRRIQNDPQYGQQIAINAQRKLFKFHTIEKRVQQITNWIETGKEPIYGEQENTNDSNPLPQNHYVNLVLQNKEQRKMPKTNFPTTNNKANDVISRIKLASQAISQNNTKLAISILENILIDYPEVQEVRDILEKLKSTQKSEIELRKNNYYSKLFEENPLWSSPEPNPDEQARWSKISKFLETVKNSESNGYDKLSILDLGCGRGWLTNLASFYGIIEGVDPVANVIEAARRLFPYIQFYSGTAQAILNRPNFQPYNIILTSEVIEHIPKDQQHQYAIDIRDLLKDGGYVILTTPRAEVYDQWMRFTNFSRQPIDEWLTEREVLNYFISLDFQCLGHDRIFVDTLNPSENRYILSPTADQINSQNILALYQVWLLKKTCHKSV